MLAFLLRRLVLAFLVLLAVSFGSFWFFARNFYTQETMLHLSPAHVWWTWFSGIPHGTFAKSATGASLWPTVVPALGHTLALLAFTFVLVVVFAVGFGTLSATREGSAVDVAVRGIAYTAWSLPAFLLALIFQKVLSIVFEHIHAQPLPLSGWPGDCVDVQGIVYGSACSSHGLHLAWGVVTHLFLPSVALATSFIGLHARYVRSSLLVALAAPYTTTARAKGLSERRVVVRHALRNSLSTFVSALFLDFGSIFGAALAVDWIFSLGGIGALFLRQIEDPNIDPNAVQLTLVFTAAAVLLSSLVADLTLSWLDPRVRLR